MARLCGVGVVTCAMLMTSMAAPPSWFNRPPPTPSLPSRFGPPSPPPAPAHTGWSPSGQPIWAPPPPWFRPHSPPPSPPSWIGGNPVPSQPVAPAPTPYIPSPPPSPTQPAAGKAFEFLAPPVAGFCIFSCLIYYCCGRKQKKEEGDVSRPLLAHRIQDRFGLRGRTAIPIYWENVDRDLDQALDRRSPEHFDDLYPVSPEVRESLEQLMNATSEVRSDLPGFTIIRAVRVEDATMWANYQRCAAEIQERRGTCEFDGLGAPTTMDAIEELENSDDFSHGLDPELCEAYLWHATDPKSAMKIAEDGFKVSKSKTQRFGPGGYFAEDAGKSDLYAENGEHIHKDSYAMLLCRVVLGKQDLKRWQGNVGGAVPPPPSRLVHDECDSLLAEPPGNQAREFVVYRNEQVYPEYAIVYERRNPNQREDHEYWNDDEAEAMVENLPVYWTNNAWVSQYGPWGYCRARFDEMYPATNFKEVVQDMADQTWRNVWTRDRRTPDGRQIQRNDPNGDMPIGMRVLKVLRVEDSEMWNAYLRYYEGIQRTRGHECTSINSEDVKTVGPLGRHQNRLDTDVNEVYLWHGSSPEATLSIAEDGFNIDMASTKSMFGPGAYLAECSSKADEYSKDEPNGLYKGYYAMLLCRVMLGEVNVIQDADKQASLRLGPNWPHDSLIGDREAAANTYREFVVPTKEAVYPEYAIIYERIYNQTRVRGISPATPRTVYALE